MYTDDTVLVLSVNEEINKQLVFGNRADHPDVEAP